jgi:hypothetical protein
MMQHTVREDVNNFLGYKVEMRSVSKKGGFSRLREMAKSSLSKKLIVLSTANC